MVASLAVAAIAATHRDHASDAARAAGATGPATAAQPATSSGAQPSETSTGDPVHRLGRSGLSALALTSSDLAATSAGLSSKHGVKSGFVTLKQYRAGYQSATDPSSCAVARGLMEFTDTDAPGSADWRRPSILRREDLRLAASSQTGSQQIRQFSSEAAAVAFMEHQQTWFADCGHLVFSWSGSSGTVSYDGGIVQQQGSEELLAQGAIGGLSSGATSEFDGWVRRGSVVYASYLLGDASTPLTDLGTAGRAIAAAAAAKLEAKGAA